MAPWFGQGRSPPVPRGRIAGPGLGCVATLGLVVAVAGCRARPGAGQAAVPSEEAACQALQVVLDAWRDGVSGPLRTTTTAVEVADQHRKPGQRLRKYTILGPAPGDVPRCFAVRLFLEGPTEELRARYIVVGTNPMWVFRYEDYEMMVHWMCSEDEQAAPPTTKKK